MRVWVGGLVSEAPTALRERLQPVMSLHSAGVATQKSLLVAFFELTVLYVLYG